MSSFLLWFTSLSLIVALIALIFLKKHRVALQDALRMVLDAKQEAKDMAQLPMQNPYPKIQCTEEGEILFMNPATEVHFQGILHLGIEHPAIGDFTTLKMLALEHGQVQQEIMFNGKYYQQTICIALMHKKKSFIIYYYDISERKKYEEQMRLANEKEAEARQHAERMNAARGEFLANMSHELRTPMNGILGLSDLLAKSMLPENAREMAGLIHQSATHLLTILNDILDFSKIEAGELRLEHIPMNIQQLIHEMHALQHNFAAQKDLAFTYHFLSDVPAYVMGDPARFLQILNNLVHNAIKFTARGSIKVEVEGKQEGAIFNTLIHVTDTGIGIPTDKQQLVFSKFCQAESSTARTFGGTGLGLSIIRELVAMFSGTITLQSTEDIGTRFSVHLPFAICDSAQHELPSPADDQKNLVIHVQSRVLIVDDSTINLLVLRLYLEKLGFIHIDEAPSGQEAVDLCIKHHYDLILMDIQMPKMDGFEATTIIRTQPQAKDTIIIAVTADAMAGAETRCLAAGMDAYISKPIQLERLQLLLQQWLGTISENSAATAHPSPATPSLRIFDHTYFSELTDGDQETQQLLLTLFISQLQDDMAEMEEYIQAENLALWRKKAHKLCGSAANIGAYQIADSCRKAEALSENTPLSIAHALHQQIKAEQQRTLQEVSAFVVT